MCRASRLATLLLISLSAGLSLGSRPPAVPTPVELPDFPTPTVPANPTQVDRGGELYYYHCMTCHGDRGQGLTDEWRAQWVPDHRNCWARGCHGGGEHDEAWPLPRQVPAIIGPPPVLSRFPAPDDLYGYLRATHPPQRPGYLADADYWALTAYLLQESGRLAAGQTLPAGSVVPDAVPASSPAPGYLAALAAAVLALAALAVLVIRRRKAGRRAGGEPGS